MGSKTLRRLAVAAVVLVLGVVSIVLLQRYQVRRMGQTNLVKAEEAAKAGDLAKAEELYLQHVMVFPKDSDAQLAYAKVLMQRSKTPARMGQAIQIYRDVLNAQAGRDDVRRAMIELVVESGRKDKALEEAMVSANVLSKRNPQDGDLNYLMGRCQQLAGEDRAAAESYSKAFAGRAKERFDAVQRLATLYRTTLEQPEKADAVVEDMVKQEPGDYRSYLERGHYRELTAGGDLGPIEADFKEAARLAPGEAEPYLALAQVAANRTPPALDEASRYLEQGLAAAPKAGRLHLAKAMTQFRGGDNDGGLKTLRHGLEVLPDDVTLRLTLADVLAQRGATAELRDQVLELNRLGMAFFAEYYTAHAYVNARDWNNAKKILLDRLMRQDLSSIPDWRGKISNLLARCYAALGDTDRQRTALASAVRDDPNNVRAKVAYIADLAAQGEFGEAIAQYRQVAASQPAARVPLAQLLIDRTRRQAPAQRDWTEVEKLIDEIARDEPDSSQPVALRAQVLTARGLRDDALAALEAARAKAPRDRLAILIWTSIADLKSTKQDYPGALKALDEAREALGDSGELRLARAKILAMRGGDDLAPALVETARDIDFLPLEQRVAVLNAVGEELQRRGDRAEAATIWARYAEVAPQDLRPRLQMLTNALLEEGEGGPEALAAARSAIEKALAEVHRAEGPDGYMGRYGDLEYKIWQAKHAEAADKSRIRAEARALLAELRARRPDWSVVPLTTARIEEQEMAEIKDEAERRRRLNRVADLYREAVEMGQRNLTTVRRATDLLMEADRTSEVGQLWAKVPALNSADADSTIVERSVLDNVLRSKDYTKAAEIVRQRIAARPGDLSERILMAQLLLWQKKPDDAEAQLREAVAADPADPNRRIVLIQFLVSTGQVDKAELAANQVEQAVGPEKAPLAMAACSDMIVMAAQATAREPLKAKWMASAKGWYARAQAAKPAEFSIRRAYIEFLLRTNQVDEVEKELAAILSPARTPAVGSFNPADVAWAKRTLALTYVARSELTHDYQQAMKARNLFAPTDRDAKLPEEGEDLRVLARVYEAQKFIPYRLKAIEVLEKLTGERRASDDDRFLLARLYQAEDRWDDAHALFRDLMNDKDRPTTNQDLNQQVIRLVYYTSTLIAHVQADARSAAGQADAAEAQELIDRLRKLQPDGFNVLAFQARLEKATGKADQAAARIKELADRPQLAPALARATAGLAETLELPDVAEAIFKRNAESSGKIEDQLEYAAFLGRRGRPKDALDVCEPLWKSSPNPEPIAPTVISIVLSSKANRDETQIARVSGWIERSLQQKPDSPLLVIALGTIRDREGRYSEAVELYRQAVAKGKGEVIPLNNLAWLLTLQGEKDGPLDMINKAIALRGPIPEFLDTRAIVYLTNGESKRAIEDLENAIAIDPSASRYFHLARAYLDAGNLEAAKKSFVRARDKGLDPADVHPLERPALAQVEGALK